MTAPPPPPTSTLRRLVLPLLAVAGLLGACTSSSAGSPTTTARPTSTTARPSEVAFPGQDWATTTPEAAGFDEAELQRIADDAQTAGSNCLAVFRRGKLVQSWYWNGTDASTTQNVFSATKSYTSALVGIAQAAGKLDVRDSASTYIPEWTGTPAADVTVQDLLSNDSGRQWSAAIDYSTLISTPDRTALAIGLNQDHAPGQVWVYNNAAIQTLDAVLGTATGQDPAAYAEAHLLGPIGMARSEMTHDAAGNTNMFFGLTSSCEDMGRFGLLYEQHGNWDGTQVVPASWVRASTGRPSQQLNAAYGYLWWINRKGPVTADPLKETTAEEAAAAPATRLVPQAPADMFWAIGLGGQIIQVDPGSQTVVVRLGPARRLQGSSAGGSSAFGPAQTARVVTEALTNP